MDTSTAIRLAPTPLERLLRAEGRRQSWLSTTTGIKPQRLSSIVRGMRPDLPEALAIAEALGRSVADFWEIDGDDDPAAGVAA